MVEDDRLVLGLTVKKTLCLPGRDGVIDGLHKSIYMLPGSRSKAGGSNS